MPKKIDPSILQALYACLSLQELRDTRDNLLAQLDVLNRLIADRSGSVSDQEESGDA